MEKKKITLGSIGTMAALLSMNGNTASPSGYAPALPDIEDMGFLPELKKQRRELFLDEPAPDMPIPAGCKEYFFNDEGNFDNRRMLRDDCVFKCIAINKKSAINKFNKWQQQSKQPNHEQ